MGSVPIWFEINPDWFQLLHFNFISKNQSDFCLQMDIFIQDFYLDNKNKIKFVAFYFSTNTGWFKKNYQLHLKSAIFHAMSWKHGFSIIRERGIRIWSRIQDISIPSAPKLRPKTRKMVKNQFVWVLNLKYGWFFPKQPKFSPKTQPTF